MSLIARSVQAAAALSLILIVGACGGGGDDPAEVVKFDDRIAPFIGHWVACVQIPGTGSSEKDDMLITAAGPNKVTVTRAYTQHDNSTDCTGTSLLLEEETSDVTLLGQTVTVSGIVLEKFSQTGQVVEYNEVPPGSGNLVAAPAVSVPLTSFAGIVQGATPTLYIGDDTTFDAQGNPQALLSIVHNKVP